MTHRRDLERHRASLGEIGEILGSMKTLAYMETRKLARFLAAEEQVVESIRTAASDFLYFHPELVPARPLSPPVVLLVGSERGFCGDFNRMLVHRYEDVVARESGDAVHLIVIGRKLHTLLDEDPRLVAFIEGASVAEDIQRVMQEATEAIGSIDRPSGDVRLIGISHAEDGVEEHDLLPPFTQLRDESRSRADPPLLNLSPVDFLFELTEHYLFSAMSHMLSTSLMVENDRRVAHLEHAVRRIDDESRALTLKTRALRQEEITEEIEVILLSAASLDDAGQRRGRRHRHRNVAGKD